MKAIAAITGVALLAPVMAQGLSLEFPAMASPLADRSRPYDSYFLPIAPFADGKVAGLTAEGPIQQSSWRVGNGGLTTLQILAPLREQLQDAGYVTVFECKDRVCGGYDFRFRMNVLPEPDMHVNLGDYRYLLAKRPGDPAEYVSLVVSSSANAGFVQITRIGKPDAAPTVSASAQVPDTGAAIATGEDVGRLLETVGHATLDDVYFQTGSSTLGEETFVSLSGLADYLKANPERGVVLVGHTDAEGALEGNIALSRRRAAAVAERLVQQYDIPPGQISADGVGYLAPRASNLSDEGRTLNRRVEVVLTSTQ